MNEIKDCKDCKHSFTIFGVENPELRTGCKQPLIVNNWGNRRIAKYARLYGPCKLEGKYWEAKDADAS